MRLTRVRVVSLVQIVLVLAPVVASAMDPGLRCVDVKNKAAARLLRCLAREHQKLLLGRPSDPSGCRAKLARAFANAEKPGACPATGDAAAVQQRVDDIAASVLDALHASMATTDARKQCLARENNAAAGYAVCYASALGVRLRGLPLPIALVINRDVGKCSVTASRPFENTPDCLVGFIDRNTVLDVAVAAAGNLEGADLRGAPDFFGVAGGNLRNADLSGLDLRGGDDFRNADLTGANLTGARLGLHLSGANLSGVTWGATQCPDATFSDTNGTSPESCCGHLGASVPAACSP